MNKIWSKDYEVGDYWSRADLGILIGEPFQIVLEAIAGDGYAGDIAIDDTSFTPGCILANVDLVSVPTSAPPTTTPDSCVANNQFMCIENNQCIDKEKVCDFKVDCPIPGGSDEAECGTCTFDDNNGTLCSWKDFSYGSLQWKLETGSINLGPSGDHTIGNGFYVAVPPTTFYQFASLRTGAVGPSSFECQLKFWYYMDFQPSDITRISVYIRRQADNFTTFSFISSITEATGPQWKQGVINIGHRAERFAIGIPKEFYLKKEFYNMILSFQKSMEHLAVLW
jgi:hypothetical protein